MSSRRLHQDAEDFSLPHQPESSLDWNSEYAFDAMNLVRLQVLCLPVICLQVTCIAKVVRANLSALHPMLRLSQSEMLHDRLMRRSACGNLEQLAVGDALALLVPQSPTELVQPRLARTWLCHSVMMRTRQMRLPHESL